MRELLSKRPQPYYIYAPDYRRTSSGIRVMHMLCDALIRSGYEAYVTAEVLSPEFMTPRLTDEVASAHRSQGLEPIVVYPEIVNGNPLKGTVVVRYILNRPGFLAGGADYGKEDILFAYSRDLVMPGMSEDQVMLLPPFDLNIFCPPSDPLKRVKGKTCYYLGRQGELTIDPALLPPDAVEITPHWPASWEEMAELFQQCEFFYCCGSSALATEAGLCGCLTVVIVEEGAPRIGVTEAQSPGVAWGMAPEELEHARLTLPQVRDVWLKLQKDFWPALDHFIEVTQASARQHFKTDKHRKVLDWLSKRAPVEEHAELIASTLNESPNAPRLHVVIKDLHGELDKVIATIKSLDNDRCFYRNVTLTVLTTLNIPAENSSAALQFSRITPRNWVEGLNRAVDSLAFDWMMLVEAGSEFTQVGLQTLALELLQANDLKAVYGDVIEQGPEGEQQPLLRPGFNLDLLLSYPAMMASHWFFRREELLALDGFDPAFTDACELDVILRMVERNGLQGFAHIDEPLLIARSRGALENPVECQVITRHLKNRGYDDACVESVLPGRYRIDYAHADSPLVSIVIALESELLQVERCVSSVLEITRYPNYELILLAAPNINDDLRHWLAELASIAEGRVRIEYLTEDTTFAMARDAAAASVMGEYLLLLADSSIVIQHDWLGQMLNHGLRPEVAAVGAKVLYRAGGVKHAGIVLGLRGVAGGAFIGEAETASGYMGRLQLDQNYSAVSADCMLVRRSSYLDVGGMGMSAEYADVDLCLRLGQAGYLIVWAARALLQQAMTMAGKKESGLSGGEQQARARMYEAWLPVLAHDPAYNQNLSLEGFGFTPDYGKTREWQPIGAPLLPRVLCHPSDGNGCGHYRLHQPFLAMQRDVMIEGVVTGDLLSPVELERFAPQSIIYQRQFNPQGLLMREEAKSFSGALRVMDMDDFMPGVPEKSIHYKDMPKNVMDYIKQALSLVDRFVVSTTPLAEAFAGLHPDIRVVNNRLPVEWWGNLNSTRREGGKPRVGWAGGTSHTGDLELIVDVVRELADEVEWVFFGMCPEALRPYVHELHKGIAINLYPQYLANLGLDLALAPLEMNLFNECKSNLRILEYGACGFPVICTDITPYRCGMPVTLVKNRTEDWLEAIRMHLSDLDETARMGDALRSAVQKSWMLEGNALREWHKAWLPD